MPRFTIVIPPDGSPRALYSEKAKALLSAVGDVQTRRASHVEPTDSLSDEARQWLIENYEGEVLDAWWADLTPVNGPVLGPYDTRDYALMQELEWLRKHQYPFPHNTRDWDDMMPVGETPVWPTKDD